MRYRRIRGKPRLRKLLSPLYLMTSPNLPTERSGADWSNYLVFFFTLCIKTLLTSSVKFDLFSSTEARKRGCGIDVLRFAIMLLKRPDFPVTIESTNSTCIQKGNQLSSAEEIKVQSGGKCQIEVICLTPSVRQVLLNPGSRPHFLLGTFSNTVNYLEIHYPQSVTNIPVYRDISPR